MTFVNIDFGGAAASNALATPAWAAGGEADREQRMKWWHEARFGMFIHWWLDGNAPPSTRLRAADIVGADVEGAGTGGG